MSDAISFLVTHPGYSRARARKSAMLFNRLPPFKSPERFPEAATISLGLHFVETFVNEMKMVSLMCNRVGERPCALGLALLR